MGKFVEVVFIIAWALLLELQFIWLVIRVIHNFT